MCKYLEIIKEMVRYTIYMEGEDRSLVNVGSFLHMTMVVCEKSTLGPTQEMSV